MKDKFHEALADTLRTLREYRGLSLRAVQDRTGVSNAYLSQIERGKRGTPTLGLLEKLAKVYGSSVPQLLGEVEKSLPSKSGIVKLTTDAAYVGATFEKLSDDRQKLLLDYLKYLEASQSNQDRAKSILKRGRARKGQ